MEMQVLLRRTCVECDGQGCPKCNGTGWVEFWHNLEWLVAEIKRDEPIVVAVTLDRLGLD